MQFSKGVFLLFLWFYPWSATAFTWREYGNNYDAIDGILGALVETVGHPARWKYPGRGGRGDGPFATRGDVFEIPYDWMNGEVRKIRDPDPRRESALRQAFVTFVVAHEYFHLVLDHPGHEGPIVILGETIDYPERDRFFERQVDFLAAKYLLSRGLPLDSVTKYFRDDPDTDERHPPGNERAHIVESARHDGVDRALFPEAHFACHRALAWL